MPAGSDGRPAWKRLAFPEVPEPQAGDPPLAETLRKGDAESVWNEGAGQLSSAGLPVRLLAVRALALKAAPADTAVLCNRLYEILWSEPCALTPVILEEIEHSMESRGTGFAGTAMANWKRQWSVLMTWRALYLSNGPALETLTKPQWLTTGREDGRYLVTGRDPWLALNEESVQQLIASTAKEQELPAGLRLEYAKGPAGGEVLAESVPLPGVRAVVSDPRAFSRTAWRRTGWLAGFAGLAVAGTLWGSRQMLRALQRQAELSRQKNNFIASVSHELRTPLASLRVLSENLHAGRVSDAEMRGSYFPLMVDECRRLGALVENVLEFARAEDGRSEFHFAGTDIAAMTEDTVQLLRPRVQQCGLQIEVETPPLPESVVADAMSLHRALLNLLDNAIKFTPAGGRIAVTLQPAETGWWSLTVRDTGPGIPRREHERIFERFYRSGSELTRTVPGTGIGLSIVQHVAEGHGGRVSVESAPGSGAAFTLHLPCNPPQTRG
jgi:two-component system phosphate regulon sensor histidine kinase PhoR